MPEYNLKKHYYRDFFVHTALPPAILIAGAIVFIGVIAVGLTIGLSSLTSALLILSALATAIAAIIAIAALALLGAAIATLAKYANDKINEPKPFEYNDEAKFDSTNSQQVNQDEVSPKPNNSTSTPKINNDSTFNFGEILNKSCVGGFFNRVFHCIDSKTVETAQKNHNDYVNQENKY